MMFAHSRARFALIVLLLCGGTAHATSGITPSSFAKAAAGLKSYCLERMCLGMTVAQVEALGQLTWGTFFPADGRQSCEPHNNSAIGDFKAVDGTAMELTFEPVTQAGSPMSRYRLTNISLKLPDITTTQAIALLETLITRYGPMQERKDVSGLTTSKDQQFSIFIIRFNNGERRKGSPAEIVLGSIYRFKAQWVMSLPKCKAGLPKV